MTRRRPRVTRAIAALALVSAAAVLTACGSSAGGDVKPLSADDDQTSSATATPTSSASTSEAASTGPQTYTADLEAQAPVKVVRAWASAVADEVNSRSGDHGQTKALSTARGQRTLPALYEEDYAYRYPGPLPFGPQRLVVSGRSATLTACVMTAGWAVERGTGQATSSNGYGQYSIGLRREGGAWKMDQMKATGAQCSGADLKGSR